MVVAGQRRLLLILEVPGVCATALVGHQQRDLYPRVRANTDLEEKANILAAIRGEFSTETVARALRERWGHDDLARRDKAKMGTIYLAGEGDDTKDLAWAADDEADLAHLSEEAKQAYAASSTAGPRRVWGP